MFGNFLGLFGGQLVLPVVGGVIDIPIKYKTIDMPFGIEVVIMQGEFRSALGAFALFVFLTGGIFRGIQINKIPQFIKISLAYGTRN